MKTSFFLITFLAIFSTSLTIAQNPKKTKPAANCRISLHEIWVTQNGQMVTDVHVGGDYTLGITGSNVENFAVLINNTVSYAYLLAPVKGGVAYNIHFGSNLGSRLGKIETLELLNKCTGETIQAKLYQPVNVVK